MIPGSQEVMDQVYWGGELDVVRSGLAEGWIKEYQIRFFVGYASWETGQLDREISENSWLVTHIDRLDIMHGSDILLWENVLKNEDERYQMWTRYPEDPAWN
jgi:putative transcriptional regulator